MKFILRVVGMLMLTLVYASVAYTQDTLRLTMDEADQIFLKNNLELLAGQLNVSAQKAAEVQAKLYPNPVISGELNAWDPQNKQWFHTGVTGQKALSAEQLIVMGGKRRNEIELARKNTDVASLELEDLLRSLTQQLHTSLYSVYFDTRTLYKFDAQLQLLDTIIAGYEAQAAKGNIAARELVRLKSVYLNLNNDKTSLLRDMIAEQEKLKQLLRTKATVVLRFDTDSLTSFSRLPARDSLIEAALANRPDRKIAAMSADIAALNIRYQKSLAVPDLTLGGAYDQAGGAFANQINLTLSMGLPLWHRNQGNIRMARVQAHKATVLQDISKNAVTAEVAAAYDNMQRSLTEYTQSQRIYNSVFREVFNGITDNFLKRNISIVEFVDFFESYNESIAALNRVRKQLALCAEEVNYATAARIYP
jgi:cobalt-zinc-cadmium efflux system outer membrane protein